MTLPLELGGIHDPQIRRALEQLSQQFPDAVTGGGGAPTGAAGGVLGGTYPNPSFAVDMATQAELDTHAALTTTAHGGIVASTDTRLTDARAPTGAAGGDLSGTYPNPQIGSGVIVDADVNAAAAIAETKLNLATDAAAGTGSRRTLGTTATSAAAGNRGLPVGGTAAQVLTKNSGTDYDVGWTTPSGGGGTPAFVTSLPGSPVDTQEAMLVVDTAAAFGGPLVWHCKFRTTTAKWHVMGPPLTVQLATQQGLSANNGTFVDATTAGPTVIVPNAGDYLVSFTATGLDNTLNTTGAVGVKPGAGAVTFEAEAIFPGVINTPVTLGRTDILFSGLAASTALKMQYKASAGTSQFKNRALAVWPVRIT